MTATSVPAVRGPVFRYLADDHVRLDGLLGRAVGASGAVDLAVYAEFRGGLLRHIAMEEKVLLPDAQQRRGGEPLPAAEKLRFDHGAIAALLVPTPTPQIVAALRALLAAHNVIEEGAGGVYESCERLAGAAAADLLARLRDVPAVPMAPYNDGPRVMPALRRALARAGYDFDTLAGAR